MKLFWGGGSAFVRIVGFCMCKIFLIYKEVSKRDSTTFFHFNPKLKGVSHVKHASAQKSLWLPAPTIYTRNVLP